MAQHGIDVARNRGPVLDAGEAVAAEICRDGVVGGRAALVDLAQQADGGFDPGPRRHSSCR